LAANPCERTLFVFIQEWWPFLISCHSPLVPPPLCKSCFFFPPFNPSTSEPTLKFRMKHRPRNFEISAPHTRSCRSPPVMDYLFSALPNISLALLLFFLKFPHGPGLALKFDLTCSIPIQGLSLLFSCSLPVLVDPFLLLCI